MQLFKRIRKQRNDSWYSPIYTLQRRLRKHRDKNSLIPFEDIIDGVYRMFTGRLDRPSKWLLKPVTVPFNAESTLQPDYKEPEVTPNAYKRKTRSKNHIGIFSILFSVLDVAETALRGNMARNEKTRQRLAASTLVLWGAINVTRALFGLVGVALSLIPASIFYLTEKARFEKQQKAKRQIELAKLRDKNIVDVIQDLNKEHNKNKIDNNQSYWVIKECDNEVTAKVKKKPITNKGNYNGIYATNHELEQVDSRLKNTIGNKFTAIIQNQSNDSYLTQASLFKATLDKVPANGNKYAERPYNRKFIYIPPARP